MFNIICGHIILIKNEELVNIFFKICKNPVKNKNSSFKCFGSILLIIQKVGKSQGFSLVQRLSGIKMNKLRAKSKG
jgi:hypothetical protein